MRDHLCEGPGREEEGVGGEHRLLSARTQRLRGRTAVLRKPHFAPLHPAVSHHLGVRKEVEGGKKVKKLWGRWLAAPQ